MSLEDIVSVTITKESAQIDRASFGTILIASYHTHGADRIVEYTASSMLKGMVANGFATTEPAYLAAVKALSQQPRVSKIKIGRLLTAWNQTLKIVPTVANTTIYAGTINALPWTFTSDGSATLAEICTGIATAIDLLAGITATGVSGTDVIVSVTAAGTLMNFDQAGTAGAYTLDDVTADTGLATDLNTLRALDADWYGLLLDSPSAVRNLTAASWAETQRVLFAASSADRNTSATSISDDSHALSLARTGVFYHPDANAFPAAAAMGVVFPYDPGTATWKFKTLANVRIPTAAEQSATVESALKLLKANVYSKVGGIGIVSEGTSASGEYLDITQGIDYLTARMTEAVFALLAATPKLPYTDKSGDRIRSVMDGVLRDCVNRGILADDPKYTITIPLVSSQSVENRAARIFDGIKFSGRLAGAIHSLDIDGSLSV